jgi:hypothetical protein
MHATIAVSTTAAAPEVPPSFQEIPLQKIQESPTNPRRQFDVEALRPHRTERSTACCQRVKRCWFSG